MFFRLRMTRADIADAASHVLRAALCVLAGFALGAAAGAARAQGKVASAVGALEVAFVANGLPLACTATDVSFAIGPQTTVSWQCVGGPVRLRCTLLTPAQFALDVKVVALDCNRLTEVPPGSGSSLIFAGGFEDLQ